MNIEQMRARLAAIVAVLGALQAKSELSDEETTQVEEMGVEFETLTKKIEAREKLDAMIAKAGSSNRQTAAQTPAAVTSVGKNRIEDDPKRGFKNAGEFYNAVQKKNEPVLAAAGLSEKFGEDGGFLVPEDFRLDIQKKISGDQSLLARTRQFQTGSNILTLPTYEAAPYDANAFQAYWEAEAQLYKESKTKFSEVSMRLSKLTALVRVTDELLEDSPAMESFIRANAPDAMLHKLNSAIIAGVGGGMPQGYLNSTFKVKIAAEGGQTAGTVVFANVNKMLAGLVPSSMPNAVWIVNPNVLPQLRTMVFAPSSTVPVPVYMPSTGVSGAPYGTLFGMPILPMLGGVKALGVEGDIALVDLNYYYTAVKVAGGNLGIKTDISTHVFFDTNESAFRFTMRVAGQVPYKSAIVNQAGDYTCSGIVTLADRP